MEPDNPSTLLPSVSDRVALNIEAVIFKFRGALNLDYGLLNDRPGN
jgi:hypothetical protein